ncbi:MAG: hypothetical protein ACI9OJ_002473 [Myxococcota bacterium]|jgi:hypothetical protein
MIHPHGQVNRTLRAKRAHGPTKGPSLWVCSLRWTHPFAKPAVMRIPTMILASLLLLTSPSFGERGFSLLETASAEQNPRQFGPFRLGMTANDFRNAASAAGLRVRPEVMQERDMMGLALMPVMPVVAASSDSAPAAGRVWTVTAYLLSNRVAYLDVFFATEDTRRRDRWFKAYGAPSNVINKLQDITWMNQGVVTHTDRFGTRIAAVDWGGLKASSRVLVGPEGAVTVANRFFRRRNSRIGQASLDHIRVKVIEYYAKLNPGEDREGCVPPPSTDYTPAETACDQPDKRFDVQSDKWKAKPWADLGIRREMLSRNHSYLIDSSGTGRNTRITIVAMSDIDCDQQISTTRVVLRPDRAASSRVCKLGEGSWDVINPLE